MTEEATQPLTEEQIKAQMTDAVAGGDWTTVKRLAAELDKLAKLAEKAAKDALQQKLAEVTSFVKSAVDKAVQKIMDSGQLDGADGVWYAYDFGDQSSSCRVTKTKAKAAPGTGTGKSSYVTGFPPSDEMIALVGDQVMFAEDTDVTINKETVSMKAGMTLKEAYDFSTNGGWRNRVRQALGKAYTKATEQ